MTDGRTGGWLLGGRVDVCSAAVLLAAMLSPSAHPPIRRSADPPTRRSADPPTRRSADPPLRPSVQYPPGERVLITDFSSITALAASPLYVFAATAHGLTIYNRQSSEWQLPVTILDGYPRAPVRAAVADVMGNAVWLGTDAGWARYDADLHRWDGAAIPGGVRSLLLDAADPASGIYLQTSTEWVFLPRGGVVPFSTAGRPLPPPGRRITPLGLEQALNTATAGDAFRAFILTDSRLRSYTFTAAARSPDQREIFFGTNGAGLIRIDPATAAWEALPFGLGARGAGAVVVGKTGVWAASFTLPLDSRPQSDITLLSPDLTRATLYSGRTYGSDCRQSRGIALDGTAVWVACDAGVLRVDSRDRRARLFPLESVLAIAASRRGLWVGTPHGLRLIDSTDHVSSLGNLAEPIYSLALLHDTLWVGTARGLAFLPNDGSDLYARTAVPGPEPPPALGAPVLLVARIGEALAVATTDQFVWRDAAGTRWTVLRPPAEVGDVTDIAGLEGSAWIAGTGGVAFCDLAHSSFETLTVPRDLPAPVRGVAVDSQYVWMATDSGVVRLARHTIFGP